MGVVTVFAIVSITFVLIRMAPGTPAQSLLGLEATPDMMAALTARWGLDQPIYVQYAIYMRNLLTGDFGQSLSFQMPVLNVIASRLPNTVILAVAAVLLSALIALPLGVLMARRPGGIFDTAAGMLTILGQSMPDFWIGVMLILIFALTLGVLPTSGMTSPGSIILPAVTLAILNTAIIARTTRLEVGRVTAAPFMMVVKAHGLSPRQILMGHTLRNAAIPIVTVLGTIFIGMLNGVTVVEFVFSWPGLGLTAIQALDARDYPLLQGIVIVTSIIAVSLTLVIDLLYTRLDPRVRLSESMDR